MSRKSGLKADYFISYATKDKGWAIWIGWMLEEEGRSVILQEWDFTPGRNFVLEMDRATRDSEHTIAVLTPNYLASHFTHPEWAAAFAKDPKGEEQALVPIRVEECVLDGLLAQVVYLDLVNKTEEEARTAVSQMVRGSRLKPVDEPKYPGQIHDSEPETPVFPVEEEGFLDFVERGVEDLQKGNESALAFAKNVEGLGKSASEHASRFQAVTPGRGQLQEFRKVSRSAAGGMSSFSELALVQLREMAVAYESGFGAWSSALAMLPEFGEVDEHLINENQLSLEKVLHSIPRAREATAGLRDSVGRLPRVDGVFALARKRAAGVLDQGVRALDRVEFLAKRANDQGESLLHGS